MNDRLVTTCINVLRGLPPSGMSVNKIIDQTSRDRSHVILAIRTLAKGKLVEHDRWSPGKSKVIKLTYAGAEIKDLLENLSRYRESYKKLKEVDTQIKNNNRNLQDGIRFVKDICQKDILFALAYRYVVIYYVNNLNETGNAILIKIISDAIIHHLSSHLSKARHPHIREIVSFSGMSTFDILVDYITYDMYCLYTKDFQISSCENVSQEIKDVMTAILRITKPSKVDLNNSLNLIEAHNVKETDLDNYTQEDAEMLYDIIKQREYVRYGPFDQKPNSKEIREKDRQELKSIYKNLLP